MRSRHRSAGKGTTLLSCLSKSDGASNFLSLSPEWERTAMISAERMFGQRLLLWIIGGNGHTGGRKVN